MVTPFLSVHPYSLFELAEGSLRHTKTAASPLYVRHLVVSCAMAFELTSSVVFLSCLSS